MSPTDELTAREAIAALVHRYADAVVRRDKDQWEACWAQDARWQLGPGRSVVGRAGAALPAELRRPPVRRAAETNGLSASRNLATLAADRSIS